MVITYSGRRASQNSYVGLPWGVDAGGGWAYKRGPSVARPWGLLIEIVEKREGMRGRRPDQRDAGGPPTVRAFANVWRPLIGSVREDGPGMNLRV
jgi:hypothetical protein